MEMFLSRQFIEKSLQICAHALMKDLEEKINISNDNIIWKDYLIGGDISKISLYFSILLGQVFLAVLFLKVQLFQFVFFRGIIFLYISESCVL